MFLLKLLLFVLVLALLIAFSYFNTETVNVKFLDYSLSLPLFSVILGSVILGGVVPTLVYTLKNAYLGNRIYKIEEALKALWTGFNLKAVSAFRKLSAKDEVYYPLLLMAKGEEQKLQNRSYTLGIAETFTAEGLLRKDIKKATELLEQALGKNWNNLRAKKRLRDLYALQGEIEKALSLQREVIKEVEKAFRKEEERVLSALESYHLLRSETFDREPKYKDSAEYYCFRVVSLLSEGEGRKTKKVIKEAVEKGFGNQVFDMLMQAKRLEPEVVEALEESKELISKELLCRLYIRLGMFDRAQELKPHVSKTLSFMVELASSHTSKELFEHLKELYRPWRCSSCGKEHGRYKFICDNCAEWFNIYIEETPQEGEYDYRLR